MGSWIRAASLDDCPPGTSREVVVGGRVVGLFNVDGELFALDGICPHQGGPLAKGRLEGACITCPWHGWQFHVRSGQHVVNPSLYQARFSVKIEQGDVFVLIDADD